MSDALRQRVLAYLRGHHVLTLATHGADGPWASAVFYASSDTTLYFLSAPDSRHCRNLSDNDNARVAATIQDDCSDWPAIKGVQLEGRVSQLDGDEETAARQLYAQKFPVVGLAAKAPAAIVKALAKVRWYRIVPTRMYFIDNSVGFAKRDEVMLTRHAATEPAPEI